MLLSIENPANTLPSSTLKGYLIADLVLTLIFSVEMIVRILAMGFYRSPASGNVGVSIIRSQLLASMEGSNALNCTTRHVAW
eukprot:SAG11_NODE_2081_length_3851_cov_2.513859_4_plen_82_part_00